MRVYLDTTAVIYLVENVAPWESAVEAFLGQPGATPQASVLTRMECRVQPLREGRGVRTPDALHLGAAIASGCDVFLTNDRTLTRCTEIRVATLEVMP